MFSNELVCNIIEYINSNINKEITIDELANIFFFDKTYIMKKFKKETTLTIHEYINNIRIYNSLFCYKDKNNILNIAIRNGFNSLEYYSETFKKVIGVSPRIYHNFILYRNISDKDKNIIDNSISNLYLIKEKTIKYLNNRKPKKEPKKVLVFK